jgi:hypothetical protein
MNSTFIRRGFRKFAPIMMVAALMIALSAANLNVVPNSSTQVLSDTAAVAIVGGNIGCTATGAIVGGVVVLAVSGLTVGIGTAFAIAAAVHVTAIYCVAG